jgi:transcriptional regulator with XRE-family HTH domain
LANADPLWKDAAVVQKRHRLAQRRKAVGLSQEGLAELIGVDRSTVVRWERGETHPQPWHRPKLARALAVSIEELTKLLATTRDPGEGERTPPGPGHPHVDRMVQDLRGRLLVRQLPGTAGRADRELAAVEADVQNAHRAYQRADYTGAIRMLPALIADAEQLARRGASQPAPAHRLLALSYLAASKVAAKLGDGLLAWVAADRAVSAALVAGDRPVAAAGAYQVARALLQAPGRLDDAGQVLDSAIADLERHGRPDNPVDLSVRGALLLLDSVVAACGHRPTAAARRLAAAGELAGQLHRDENLLWTGFGPTNVQIHQVSVAVELQRPERAIEIGERLDTSALPPALLSRRAQVHVDLAAASSLLSSGRPAAVLHLLEAERIAPEVVRISHTARSLLGGLLRHERRSTTPGLRQLAARAGMLV